MGGAKADLKKALKTYGWALERHGTRHDLYHKAGELLSIPTGTKMYSRAVMNIMQQIKGKSKRFSLRVQNELPCSQEQPTDSQGHE
jgi:predicted RNA binding protein YcfA (HicA-like mRNA interferase family)